MYLIDGGSSEDSAQGTDPELWLMLKAWLLGHCSSEHSPSCNQIPGKVKQMKNYVALGNTLQPIDYVFLKLIMRVYLCPLCNTMLGCWGGRGCFMRGTC